MYFHGYTSAKENTELYKTLINNIATNVDDRLHRDQAANASGIIVNTTGWIDGDGFTLLLHAIERLHIDVVLVMGHDKLYSNLVTSLAGAVKSVAVVKLPRSGGVVSRVSILYLHILVYFCIFLCVWW